jgi:hypothetical protein
MSLTLETLFDTVEGNLRKIYTIGQGDSSYLNGIGYIVTPQQMGLYSFNSLVPIVTANSAEGYMAQATLNASGDLVIHVYNPTALANGSGIPSFASFWTEPVAGQPTIAIDAEVPFTSAGASFGGIVRNGVTIGEFVLPNIGVYDISWMVSVAEAGQLALFLNGVFQPETLAGRATGTNQITNRVLVTTTSANSIIKIVNHSSASALTLTPLPGGTSAGATYLTVVQLGGSASTAAQPATEVLSGTNLSGMYLNILAMGN